MARTALAFDSFSYPNGELVATSGGNWAYLTTDGVDANVLNGVVTPNYELKFYARWTGAGTFGADQYASVRIAVGSTGGIHGVLVRANGVDATRNCYFAYQRLGSETYAGKIINGVESFFPGYGPSTAFTWSGEDRISLEAEGSKLRLYRTPNGGSLTLLDTITDTALTTGAPGFMGAGTSASIDDFEAGTVATPAVNLAAIMHHLRQQGIS